ncbi:MAG: fibronectin type III domain-containing protein [Prevotella sp.]|nr:fibronectin type III domain-containing protein [Prevotella sp.]
MKKFTFSFILLAAMLAVNAQVVYLNETFAGEFTELSTTDGATYAPDASEWSLYTLGNYGTKSPASRNILDGALTYANAGGEYILSGVGRVLDNQFKGMDTSNDNFLHYRQFSATNVSSGQIYLSFLIQMPTSIGGTSPNCIGLSNTGTGVGFGNRPSIWRTISSVPENSDFRFGADLGTSATYGPTGYNKNETYLVVAEIDYSAKAISLYINPTIAASKPVTPEVTKTNASLQSSLGYIYLRGNGGTANYFQMSGIRITDNWADAVAAKLTAPTVGAASDLLADGTGFTANWTPVDARADGYDVNVYQSSTLVKTVSVTGQATASADITGLTEGTTYTYEVIATLNDGTYSNSDPALSAPSTRSADVILQATGVHAAAYGKAVKSVGYTSLTGIAAPATAKGVLLKKTTYADGSMKMEKIVK